MISFRNLVYEMLMLHNLFKDVSLQVLRRPWAWNARARRFNSFFIAFFREL